MAGSAVEVAQAVAGHDPTIVALAWVVAVSALLVSIAAPLKEYLKNKAAAQEHEAENSDRVDTARTGAEVTLYTHLAEQVSQYRVIADQAFKERNDLIGRVASLEAKASAFDEAKSTMARMRSRLEAQELQIQNLIRDHNSERAKFLEILQNKDEEIAKRDERILSLEKGQRDLEKRLLSDEMRLGCPFQPTTDGAVIMNPVPEAGA